MRIGTILRSPQMLAAAVLLTAGTAHGAGFELQEQSGIGLGSAFAGMSTGFGDGSAVYWNPAALTALDGTTASAAAHVIVPSTDFMNEGSNYPALGGLPVSGGNGGDGGSTGVVPNIYLTHEAIEDKLVVGLGLNTPFGLSTEWNDGWVGRYHALDSELFTLNINPGFGYKLNDMISIGAAANIMYVDATLSNAVDFGTIGFATLGPATATSLGLTPQGADGKAKLDGDDWAAGGNVGVLITPLEGLEIGAGWRSQIKTTVTGDATFTVPAAAQVLTMGGAFIDTPARASITLPQSASAGFHYAINDMLGIAADVRWVDWSQFDELRVEFASNQPDSVTVENWDDSWRYAVGLDVHPCENVDLRLGYSYEETPVPGPGFRTPRIPDLDRHWFTVGAGYWITEDLLFNVSYAYILAEDGRSNVTTATGDTLVGEYQGDVNIFTGQLTYRL